MFMMALYGSLKTGFHNHYLMENSICYGLDYTKPEFEMINLGSYPGIVSGNNKVEVELYLVNKEVLEELDLLEGYPSFYDRRMIELDSGKKAHIYFLPDVYKNEYESVKEIDGVQAWRLCDV